MAVRQDVKLDQVIVCLLKQVKTPIYRTQLVKMVYFVDYIYFQHTRATLTGLSYWWDRYGPNAIGNEIVARADALASTGLVHMQPEQNVYGDVNWLYRAEDGTECPELDPIADLIIKDVAKKYGSYTASRIAAASKRTKPFKKARQGDALDFEQGSAYYRVPTSLKHGKPTEIEAGTKGKSLQELKQKYGIP